MRGQSSPRVLPPSCFLSHPVLPISQGQPPSKVLPACPGPLPVSRQPLPGLPHLAVRPQLHPSWRPSPPAIHRAGSSLCLRHLHTRSDLGLRSEAFLDAPRPWAQKVCEALSVKVKLLPRRGVGSYQGRVIPTPPRDAGQGGVALVTLHSRPPRLSLPQAAGCMYLPGISAFQGEGILTILSPSRPPLNPFSLLQMLSKEQTASVAAVRDHFWSVLGSCISQEIDVPV